MGSVSKVNIHIGQMQLVFAAPKCDGTAAHVATHNPLLCVTTIKRSSPWTWLRVVENTLNRTTPRSYVAKGTQPLLHNLAACTVF